MGILRNPNLPQGRVTHCIVSEQFPSVLADLLRMGITPITVPACPDLPSPVSCHADMVCHHLGSDKIAVYPYSETFTCKLKELGLQVIHSKRRLSSEYPNDILFNAARVGKWLVCNEKYTERVILDSVERNHIIPTKQGYAKCSVLVVDERSIITADRNIQRKASACGIDALLIQQGHIVLPGYDYGFIGGSTFKPRPDVIYFTGNVQSHPDYPLIKAFLEKRDITVINGSSEMLLDVGSILPIKETDA